MFSTGIENSVPTIDGGRTRIDEMESCGHYKHWRQDFALVQEIGIGYLRYGPPIHLTWLAPGKYDWEFADITFAELKRRGVSYAQLVDLLAPLGVHETERNLANKLSRGGFTAAFMLQCLTAVGAQRLDLV